jgi:hypothetical protein
MAFPLGNRPLPGYPMPDGEKFIMVFDHTGPTSYTQFGSGTGGDVIKASSLGLGGFDTTIDVILDTTGTYSVQAVFTLAGYGNSVPQITLKWFTTAAQTTEVSAATNLSGVSIRISAIMV